MVSGASTAMNSDPSSLSAEPFVYFLLHSSLFVMAIAAVFGVLGLFFGWLTWGKYRLRLRESIAEREGTYTSALRRVQRTYAVVDPVGRARADWKVLRDLSLRFGVAEAFATPADVFDEIARAAAPYAGLDYAALGPAVVGGGGH